MLKGLMSKLSKNVVNFKNDFVEGYNEVVLTVEAIQSVKPESDIECSFVKNDIKITVDDVIVNTKGTVAKKVGAVIAAKKESLWSKWAKLKSDPSISLGKLTNGILDYTFLVSNRMFIYFGAALTLILLGGPIVVAQLLLVSMIAHICLDTYKAIFA